MTTEIDIRLDHGFSAGNFCNSYETIHYDKAVKRRDLEGSGEDYRAAFTMGFFASYELHEIPLTNRDAFDEAYHSEFGQRVLELGYTDRRDADYAAEQDPDESTG